MKALHPAAWMLPGILLAAGIAARVDPRDYAGGRSRDEAARLRRNSSAVARLFGEFRTSLGDVLYIKTERYHHGGVGYAPHHHDEATSASELADEIDAHADDRQAPPSPGDHDHDHACSDGCAGTPTLIPEEHRDFRGFIGRLHRQVKPWRDPAEPHLLTDGRELLPWFRLMTSVDPHYIRGYVAGAFWLQRENRDAAFTFVQEGLDRNPDAFQLLVSRGLLRLKQARQAGPLSNPAHASAARPLLEEARRDFFQAAEMALRQRPPGLTDAQLAQGGDWERYMENDALAACFMAAQLTLTLGEPDAARALARRYADVFPDFAPLRDLAGRPAGRPIRGGPRAEP